MHREHVNIVNAKKINAKRKTGKLAKQRDDSKNGAKLTSEAAKVQTRKSKQNFATKQMHSIERE